MADEHFFPAGDFPSSLLGTAPCFFGSGPYAPPPPPVYDTMAPLGMMPWASELTNAPADSAQHFDSALSSLVSSPARDDDVAILGDLIGRLGSFCNNAAASASNSCYSTPLNSPPRGASLAFRQGGGCCYYPPGGGPALETGRLSRVASSKSLGPAAIESAADVETSPAAAAAKTETAATNGSGAADRKRKASGKGRTAVGNGSPKRSKLVAEDGNEDVAAADDDAAEEKKPEPEPEPEPVKDYIHVRARRGQATDSHSLAERVRREKISERMKLLQSLVPGCNKVTGKALMLDEIINYVQSLQRQVEFLSMKLSTMNPQQQLHGDAAYLPDAASEKDVSMMNQTTATAAAVLGYSAHDDDAAAFSYGDPFSVTVPHPTPTMESCTGTSFHPGFAPGGWEPAAAAQDLQSFHLQRHHDQQQQGPHDGK